MCPPSPGVLATARCIVLHRQELRDLEGRRLSAAETMIRRWGKALTGSRWERPAKRVYAAFSGNKNCLYDAQTIAVMARTLRRDSSAIDVGAFEGGMLRHICRLAPKGQH